LSDATQLQKLAASTREIDILDMAGIIRQLLLDNRSVADAANSNRLKLRFKVGVLREYPSRENPLFQSLHDAIDPETDAGPHAKSVVVNRDGLIGHPIMTIRGKAHTVKDVVGFAANIEGGRHLDLRPKEQYDLLREFSDHLSIGGLPCGVAMMRAITRVILRGLQPLIDDVNARAREKLI